MWWRVLRLDVVGAQRLAIDRPEASAQAMILGWVLFPATPGGWLRVASGGQVGASIRSPARIPSRALGAGLTGTARGVG